MSPTGIATEARQQQLLEPSTQELQALAEASALNTLHAIGGVSLIDTQMGEEGEPPRVKPAQKPQTEPEIPYYGD